MLISILTFDGFNELDSLIAFGVLNRIKHPNWTVHLCCPEHQVTSMNGVTVMAHALLSHVAESDVVIVGSGTKTKEIVENNSIMSQLRLDPSRQLIVSQCSGALVLAKLGLLNDIPACTDLMTKPWVMEAGVNVLNQPFFAKGNVATAGGCLSSLYVAAWVIAKTHGIDAAKEAVHYVAPVGEKDEYVMRTINNIEPYL